MMTIHRKTSVHSGLFFNHLELNQSISQERKDTYIKEFDQIVALALSLKVTSILPKDRFVTKMIEYLNGVLVERGLISNLLTAESYLSAPPPHSSTANIVEILSEDTLFDTEFSSVGEPASVSTSSSSATDEETSTSPMTEEHHNAGRPASESSTINHVHGTNAAETATRNHDLHGMFPTEEELGNHLRLGQFLTFIHAKLLACTSEKEQTNLKSDTLSALELGLQSMDIHLTSTPSDQVFPEKTPSNANEFNHAVLQALNELKLGKDIHLIAGTTLTVEGAEDPLLEEAFKHYYPEESSRPKL